jgi:hypothetical protein
MTARNDDYGGNQLHRMETCFESIVTGADRHNLPVEIVLVEWNPPADQPGLRDAIDWPSLGDDIDIRILTVPSDIHDRLPNADKMPLFEYIAKNVGIRRSTGEFVCSTNPDNVFSQSFFERVAEGPLDSERYYRINKYNLDSMLDPDGEPDEWEQFATDHVDSYYTPEGPFWPGQYWRHVRHVLYVYRHQPWLVNDRIRNLITGRPQSIYDLHYTASGDFILMHRDQWSGIRGHPETDFNFHIDSYTVVQAAASGLSEHCFEDPIRLYHQPHENDHDIRPRGDWETLLSRSREMLGNGEMTYFNDPGEWGLPEERLEETSVR